MIKNITISVLVGALLSGLVFWFIRPETPPLRGSTDHTELEQYMSGIRFDNSSNIAAYPNASLLNVVATTTSWNPPNVPIGGATSTEIAVSSTVTGFVRGMCQVGGFTLVSSTNNNNVLLTGCYFATSTVVISLDVPASSSNAMDIGTSTVTIYQLQF